MVMASTYEEKCSNCFWFIYKNAKNGICIYGQQVGGVAESVLTVGLNDKCHYPNVHGYGLPAFEDHKMHSERRKGR
jgi:hypothetical protein